MVGPPERGEWRHRPEAAAGAAVVGPRSTGVITGSFRHRSQETPEGLSIHGRAGRNTLGDISLVIVAFACSQLQSLRRHKALQLFNQFRTTLSLVGGGVSLRLTIRNRRPPGTKSYSGIPGLTSPVRCPRRVKERYRLRSSKTRRGLWAGRPIWSPCGRYTRQSQLAVG